MQAAIVLALLAGLVAMHQLPAAGAHHGAGGDIAAPAASASASLARAATDAHPVPPAPHSDHGDLLHLCLAVLTAFGFLVAAAALLGLIRHGAPRLRPRAQVRIRPRGPPPPVPRRLAQLCVLRN